jgi:hypothetical protein
MLLAFCSEKKSSVTTQETKSEFQTRKRNLIEAKKNFIKWVGHHHHEHLSLGVLLLLLIDFLLLCNCKRLLREERYNSVICTMMMRLWSTSNSTHPLVPAPPAPPPPPPSS